MHFLPLQITKSTVNICYVDLLALQIAKNTVNISYFALFSSPNCKKHSKYKLFCTFELSELQKTQYIQLFCTCSSPNGPLLSTAMFYCLWCLFRQLITVFFRIDLYDVYLGNCALLSPPNCKKRSKYRQLCTVEPSELQTKTIAILHF